MSLKSNSTSLKYASESLKISISNYLNYIKNPSLENDFKMCIAANLSGKAASISKLQPHTLYLIHLHHYMELIISRVALNLSKFLKFNF